MILSLVQSKLDVKRKTRDNLLNWRGQFTPDFVECLLEHYACPESIVVDPFEGSGTVLLECARKNIEAHGFEINPAACAMSKIYLFCRLDNSERDQVIEGFERNLFRLVQPISTLPFYGDSNHSKSYSNLVDLTRDLLGVAKDELARVLALNLLFQCENQKSNDLAETVFTLWFRLKYSVQNLPYTHSPITSRLCDARLAHTQLAVQPTLIITSPPYINVFNYHQNHRAILEAAGWDMLKVAVSEFGANRKNRGNRFKTVIQYALDMEQALRGFWQMLCDGGRVILIVGRESNIRQLAILNGLIVEEILAEMGGFLLEGKHERCFLNRFGVAIVEDILVLRKAGAPCSQSVGRNIAVEHLKKGLNGLVNEVQKDVMNAISECEMVQSSPLFTPAEAFVNV
ncbi:MAG: DNA methyltransferase [Armatimonadetes bacterium]|nr:DNA methyltransferase [Armatimonadota bacterium]